MHGTTQKERDKMKYQIAWLNSRPYCWVASVDEGKTWHKLKADNDEDSSEAIDEAAERWGVSSGKWQLMDEPVHSVVLAE
jgi:hypothetical protein